jgi:hypothetical protein
MEDVIVRIQHVRAVPLCTRGARAWFAHNGLSWDDFLSNGVPASTLEALGDPMAARAVEKAREEAQADGNG